MEARKRSISSPKRKNWSPLDRASEIADDVIASGRSVIHRDRAVRKADYEAAQEVAIFAAELSADVELWLQFIALEQWNRVAGGRPKIGGKRHALRYLMRLHRGGDSKSASERYTAVKFLIDEGVPLENLADEIKSHGGYAGINESRRDDPDPASRTAAASKGRTACKGAPKRKGSGTSAKAGARDPITLPLRFVERPSKLFRAKRGAYFVIGIVVGDIKADKVNGFEVISIEHVD